MGKKLYIYYPSLLSEAIAPETIEELHTHAINLDMEAPEVLLAFRRVTLLHVHSYYMEHRALPPSLLQMQQLRGLFIDEVDSSLIHRQLDALPNLRILFLKVRQLDALPEALIHMPQLEELHLKFSAVGPTFNHWHLLEHLPNLRHLSLPHLPNDQFPLEEICALTGLKELFLSRSNFRKLQKHAPEFVANLAYCFGQTDLETKYQKQLLAKVRREQTPWKKRAIWFNLLGRQYQKLDQLATAEQILEATEVQPATFSAIRLHALEYYSQRWGQAHSLAPGATLAVIGTIATKKNGLRSQLKALDIKYSSKLTETCTHLLLGQRSKGAYETALERGLPILTETQVLHYVNTHTEQYLVDEPEDQPEQLEHLTALLTSGKDENTALALALFEQGGFPKPLLTPLFYAYMEAQSNPLREQIKRLLRQYGSTGLFDLVKSRWTIFQPYTSENAIRGKLKKLEKNTHLDVLQIARYGYAQYGQGVAYLLEALPAAEAQLILQDRLNTAGELDLKRLGLNSVPRSVYQAQQVRCIDLSHNSGIRTIPTKKLSVMKQLDRLILRGNYHLRGNQKWQAQMSEDLPHIQLVFQY